MLESLIIIIPTFLALCFATSRARTYESKSSMAIMVLSVIFMWIYVFVLGWEWFDAEPVPEWLSDLHDISACLSLPIAYMAVCTAIGKNHFSFTAVALFMLVGILFVRYGALSLNLAVSTEPVDTENITFLYDGKAIGRLKNFCLVMVLQSAWIACRSIYLAKNLKKKGLHGSKKGVYVVIFIFAVLAWIFITLLLPHSVWDSKVTRFIDFIVLSVLYTSLFISIGRDVKTKLILDENDEPVYFDKKPRLEELAKKCLKLYEEDKIYLTPSLKLEDLAKLLETNRTYTAELMKVCFNTTFAAYTNAYRVEEAKKVILDNAEEKMEVIAKMCGFATAPTFTKVFKAAVGLTPSAWLAEQTQQGNKQDNKIDNEEITI